MGRKKVNKIEKFIKDNKLDFSGSGSDLNGNCVILAGYACYLGLNHSEFIDLLPSTLLSAAYLELERLLEYAYNHDYGKWWNTPDAKKTYMF